MKAITTILFSAVLVVGLAGCKTWEHSIKPFFRSVVAVAPSIVEDGIAIVDKVQEVAGGKDENKEGDEGK